MAFRLFFRADRSAIMIADEEACRNLLTLLEAEKPNLFYTKTAIEYGTI
jgi:hypothetical protein